MPARSTPKKEPVHCPYCDDEVKESPMPFCQACQVTILTCVKCRKPVPRGKTVCPHCGTRLKE